MDVKKVIKDVGNKSFFACFINVTAAGESNNDRPYYARGVRAVITLKPGTAILGGTGTDDDPYQVGPLVTRSN